MQALHTALTAAAFLLRFAAFLAVRSGYPESPPPVKPGSAAA